MCIKIVKFVVINPNAESNISVFNSIFSFFFLSFFPPTMLLLLFGFIEMHTALLYCMAAHSESLC